MSSQGEKKAYLEANQKGYPVRAGGDFVYLRKAVSPVRVIIGGQPITMEAGEKRRIPRTEPGKQAFDSFEVDNTSDVAQSVTFVVGEGDYEKIIVSGEMNVSAYVTSSDGSVSASLPGDVVKTVGLSDTDVTNTIVGQSRVNSPVVSGAGFAFGVFYFDGEFYGMDRQNLYKIDTDTDGVFKSTQALDTTGITYRGLATTSVKGCAVTKGGTVYFNHAGTIYRYSLNDLVVSVVYDGYLEIGEIGGGYGGFIIGSDYYFSSQEAGYIQGVVKFDLTTNTFTSWSHVDLGLIIYSRGDGYLYTTSVAGSNEKQFTLAGELVSDNGSIAPPSAADIAVSPLNDIAVVSDTSLFKTRWVRSHAYYGTMYVQNGADVATRRSILIDEPLEFYPSGAGTVIYGSVLKHILKAIKYGETASYLDYVISIEFFDGHRTRTIGSGTQTWELRKISDLIPLYVESEVTIGLLPGFFD